MRRTPVPAARTSVPTIRTHEREARTGGRGVGTEERGALGQSSLIRLEITLLGFDNPPRVQAAGKMAGSIGRETRTTPDWPDCGGTISSLP